MQPHRLAIALAAALLCCAPALAAPPSGASSGAAAAGSPGGAPRENLIQRLMQPMESTTTGTVRVEGKPIRYRAVAGTLVVNGTGSEETKPEVAMGYFAYFKQGADPARRPIMFLYNGGPGSSTMWLLMGAYGPERIVTGDDTHTPAAPYRIVNNDYSLLDQTDLVFIDMPGTGFGRLLPRGKTQAELDKSRAALAKQIWGVDGDGEAFSRFIIQFLSKYDRWNSPKYLYGESYGTTRSAVLANILENQDNVDLNGVVLQSQILNFGLSVDGPHGDPGVDLPYVLALPTYAATAWYHHRLPQYDGGKLGPLLEAATAFANTEYRNALYAGSTLGAGEEQAIARKLHGFTGLPVSYLLRANLRVSGGEFEHELQINTDTATGRLDSRFSGPEMFPMDKESFRDPQSDAISSAYISGFNWYVRNVLKFGQDMYYRPMVYGVSGFHWNMKHRAPGSRFSRGGTLNVMPDLAAAMTYNPNLKVMMNGGFYDLATPYYTATYELQHLPMPKRLEKNITYAFYPSGHMIYVHVPSLKQLHDNVASFIEGTDNQGAAAKHPG